MERFINTILRNDLKVYLIVDDEMITHNVFPTAGMALDAIAYNSHRINQDLIVESSRTKLKWKDNQGKERLLQIYECPFCKDLTLDYMSIPTPFVL